MNNKTNRQQVRPFYLAKWYVEPASDCIRDGDQQRKLESKVMAVLSYLASHPGEVVSRENLEREVWGNTIVSYDALTASIAKLRKALDDKSRQPRYIETVAKKGYRLIAPVSSAQQQTDNLRNENHPSKGNQSMPWIVATFVGLAMSLFVMAYVPVNGELPQDVTNKNEKASIVVLPFEDYSDHPTSRLSDGVTENLTNAMSRLSEVQVIARSSAMVYKKQTSDVRDIAKDLGVRFVIEGSVRRSENNLRVNARLIDGESGYQLWSQHYDRTLDDLFTLQDAITLKIADALSLKLNQHETQRISQRYTTSIEAYELFLAGQGYFSDHSQHANEQARSLFQSAIELDPYFARAYGALSLTYIDEYRYKWPSENNNSLAVALRYANKALNIDPQLAQAHWVQANVFVFGKQHEKAITAAKRAIELQPSYADAYATLAIANIYNERPQVAVRMLRKAMRLNPHSPARYRSALGQAYYFLGEYEEAEMVLNNAIERNAALTPARVFLIATLTKLGKNEEAEWEMEQLNILEPGLNMDKVGGMFPVRGENLASTDMVLTNY